MRSLVSLFLLWISVVNCSYFISDSDSDYVDPLDFDESTYNEFYNPDIEIRNLADSVPPLPKTGAEMITWFNTNFMIFLSAKDPKNWKNLMAVMDPKAYVETCMASSYGLHMEQFHRWMTYLSKYYLEVGLTSSVITDQSDTYVSTELTYRTEVRGGAKGADKWSMTAFFDSSKGYFCINTLHMLSECKNIPANPPLEPAIPAETFIEHLKTKLLNDIFLDDGLRYKSAYESMLDYLMPHAYISVCDVGNMNPTQFVEYWNKRYGKTKHYKDHHFEITKNEKDWQVDFAVTFGGEKGTLFRDRYQFIIKKTTNGFVEYFENFLDWTIYQVSQYCTENYTKMSKSDGSLVQMALASRRWDQMFTPGLRWDTQGAFLELFDQKTFNGYACGKGKFETFGDYIKWTQYLRSFYTQSIPQQTKVYDYKDYKIGFYIINQMTGKDNTTSAHTVYFEGYYKDDRWILNHNGFSCQN